MAAAGGTEEALAITGLSRSQLYRCTCPNESDLLSAGALLALCEHTGAADFAEVLAGLAGMTLCAAGIAGAAPRKAAAADAISEASEVAHRVAQAMADGDITPREDREIREAMADAREAFAEYERAGSPGPR